MGEIIQSIKEFVWDIIGYLIPGFAFLVLLNFFAEPNIVVNNNFIFDWNIFGSYLIIVVSYLLGFVIYSLTIFKIRNQDYLISKLEDLFMNVMFKGEKIKTSFDKYIGSKHSKYWQESFKVSSTVKSTKEFLKKHDFVEVDKMKLNEMRNILMSRSPEMDEKVYTFMFRSSVFDHLATLLLFICFAAFTQGVFIVFNLNISFLKTQNIHIALYFVFLFLIPLLGNSKRIFYSISQRIPFSNLKE